jgi:mannan endo-1,4-beta-mannosidase
MSFAHLATGGAGSGMRWPYSRPHHLVPSLRDNLCGLARFAAAVDWTCFSSRNISPWISVHGEGILSFGCGDTDRLILWLLRDKRRHRRSDFDGVSVDVHDVLRDEIYRVDLWETWEGYRYDSQEVAVENGTLTFRLCTPGFALDDIAISVYPTHLSPDI